MPDPIRLDQHTGDALRALPAVVLQLPDCLPQACDLGEGDRTAVFINAVSMKDSLDLSGRHRTPGHSQLRGDRRGILPRVMNDTGIEAAKV